MDSRLSSRRKSPTSRAVGLRKWRSDMKALKALLNDSEGTVQHVQSFSFDCSVDNTVPYDDVSASDSIDELNEEGQSFLGFESTDDEFVDDRVRAVLPESSNACLRDELAGWGVRSGIARDQLTNLLKILRSHNNPELPADARTLLQTPSTVEVTRLSCGEYIYIGIQKGLERLSEEMIIESSDGELLDIQANLDGLPIFKSSNLHLWPILCKVGVYPFLVGLWAGESSKPSNCDEVVSDFLEEREKLLNQGVDVHHKHFEVKMDKFICDAPARAMLKCTKHFSGYHSCERCTIEGTYEAARVCFPSKDEYEKRTCEDFSNYAYMGKHQLRQTILTNFSIDCVNDFLLDSMHLVYLGIVKRLLQFLISGPRQCKLSRHLQDQISLRLKNLNGKLPSEFARQPRSLDELPRWKATEYRQFLLYTGMVVLRNIVKSDFYLHFLSLCVGIRILSTEDYIASDEMVNYAEELLKYFVNYAPQLYKNYFVSYNSHSLKHLADDVRKTKCALPKIDAFAFENYLGVLKRFVRKAQKPCSQVVKRVLELERIGREVNEKYSMKIKTTFRDSWFLLDSGNVIKVTETSEDMINGKLIRSTTLENFFTEPLNSKNVGIFKLPASKLNNSPDTSLANSAIKKKLVCLPYEDNLFLAVMNH